MNPQSWRTGLGQGAGETVLVAQSPRQLRLRWCRAGQQLRHSREGFDRHVNRDQETETTKPMSGWLRVTDAYDTSGEPE